MSKKKQKYPLNFYMKSINMGKESIMEDAETRAEIESGYVPFVINRCMSGFQDTILLVNEINKRPNATKKMQYDFLFYSVRKRKRFAPWLRVDELNNLKEISTYYSVSTEKARVYLKLLDDSQLERIKEVNKMKKEMEK